MSNFFFNKALRILLITNSAILIAGAMIGPIYAIFVEEVGGSLLDASIAGGIFAVAAGVTTLIAGKYADRIKRSEMIVVFGYATMGIGFALFTQVNSILYLFLVQIIVGFSEAIYSPAFDALYTDHITKGRAGKQWGAWEAMNYFSTAIGAVVGGLIVVKLGFDYIFILMAALCFASALYIYFLPSRVL